MQSSRCACRLQGWRARHGASGRQNAPDDGFELYEKLSRIDDTVKVCFLTAYDMDYFEKFKERFPHVPTRCFINQKPISIKNLVGTVRTDLSISQPKDNLNSSSQSAS
jgi:hypothetical protein